MKLRILFFLSVAFVAGGCGDDRPARVSAGGTVTLNGEPLAGARIGFQPQGIAGYGRPSSATTDAEGKFTVGTFGSDDGIPEGQYRVTVQKSEIVGELPDGFNTEEPEANAKRVKTRFIVPRRYSDPEESGLTVEVTADGMQPDVIALEGDAEIESVGGGG